MTYSYAFGDHTLFLRKDVWSYFSLEVALMHVESGTGGIIHVYKDALYSYYTDRKIGGTLVGTFWFPDLLNRIVKKRYLSDVSRFVLMQRYVRRYAKYQSA